MLPNIPLLLLLLLVLKPDDAWGSSGCGSCSNAFAFAPPPPPLTARNPRERTTTTTFVSSTRRSPAAAASSLDIIRVPSPDRKGLARQCQGVGARVVGPLLASKKNTDPQPPSPPPSYKPADDGRSVGFVLLGLSLLVSAWLFTIPPSFRRAYLCPSDYFVDTNNNNSQQQEPDNDECVPWDVWWSNVFEYYRNGGGIQWDFSIDPQTLRDNQEFLDAIVSSYSKQ